jgi:hypothetical protein
MWNTIRQKWIDKLSEPKENAEHRVLKFLKRKEVENEKYFLEAITEMEEMISKPNTDYKYFWWFDVKLLQDIRNDLRAMAGV